ncbi:MAG: hypothetical protein Q8R44_17755 [Novosphingobium sp.]|nr:hypothetical protein [Novosphingobium sp.]
MGFILDRTTGAPTALPAPPCSTRTALIELVTLVGGDNCTETLASALELEGDDGFSLTSVGEKQLPKGFGSIQLYRLAAMSASSAPDGSSHPIAAPNSRYYHAAAN